MNERATILPAALLALGALAGADPTWRNVRLDLDVTPVPEAGLIGIEGTLVVELEGEPTRELTLAVNEDRRLVAFRDLEVTPKASVRFGGSLARHRGAHVAQVRFAEELAVGTRVELGFFCEAEEEWDQLQVDEGIAFASWVEAWHPFVPRATESVSALLAGPGTTRFHLPPGWDAVSNGQLVGRETSDEGVVVTWEIGTPVARSFAAGPYRTVRHRIGEREVGVYLLPGTELDARKQAELLARALAAQEERFGPYPYASYAIAEVPEGSGGFYASSEQGFIMARSSAFQYEHGNLPLWGHEMAHGWWGNLVGTTGPGSLLCSESLAQYSAVLAIEAVEGRAAATEFLRFSRSGYSDTQCARGYFGQLVRMGNDAPLSTLSGGGWQHDLSDAKGHWVYHMLRRRIGDERFFAGFRGLIADYAGRQLSLDALRAHFVSLAPEAELETFFEQWLDREGAPLLELEWRARDAESLELVVRQAHRGEPYHLVVDVEIASDEGRTRESITLRDRETRVVLPTTGEVGEILLDPDHALLIWTPEYGERP